MRCFVALLLCSLAVPALADDFVWPGWRGPNRTDISAETGLLKSWPKGGPKRVWIYEDAGSGYSGPAIVGDKLFTLGTRDDAEHLIALNALTGKELWLIKLSEVLENRWGNGPRSSPTVDGEFVYAMSGTGTLVCVNASNGKTVWKVEMSTLGGRRPGWGYCESVLIDGEKVVCTPGGLKGAIVALNKKDGTLIWQSSEFTDGAQYASIIAVDHADKRQYIQLTQKNIVGVDASNGKLLWQSSFPGRVAVIPTPIFSKGHVYVTSGYGAGCKLIKITDSGAEEVYSNKVMKNHHGGVLLLDGHIYGHSDGPGWTCQNFLTGEKVWSERSFGKGGVTYADGRLYCVEERRGFVALVEPSTEGWKEHGRFQLEPQSKIRSPAGAIWTHPVAVNGKLYLRDQDLIYCYDVKAK